MCTMGPDADCTDRQTWVGMKSPGHLAISDCIAYNHHICCLPQSRNYDMHIHYYGPILCCSCSHTIQNSSYLFHLQVYRSGAAQGSPTLYAYMHALYLHAGFWEIV